MYKMWNDQVSISVLYSIIISMCWELKIPVCNYSEILVATQLFSTMFLRLFHVRYILEFSFLSLFLLLLLCPFSFPFPFVSPLLFLLHFDNAEHQRPRTSHKLGKYSSLSYSPFLLFFDSFLLEDLNIICIPFTFDGHLDWCSLWLTWM